MYIIIMLFNNAYKYKVAVWHNTGVVRGCPGSQGYPLLFNFCTIVWHEYFYFLNYSFLLICILKSFLLVFKLLVNIFK